jgi:hypothetical protein
MGWFRNWICLGDVVLSHKETLDYGTLNENFTVSCYCSYMYSCWYCLSMQYHVSFCFNMPYNCEQISPNKNAIPTSGKFKELHNAFPGNVISTCTMHYGRYIHCKKNPIKCKYITILTLKEKYSAPSNSTA